MIVGIVFEERYRVQLFLPLRMKSGSSSALVLVCLRSVVRHVHCRDQETCELTQRCTELLDVMFGRAGPLVILFLESQHWNLLSS